LAHRGASSGPQNSIEAFRDAVRLGAAGIELDVQTASSGHLMVYHDLAVPGVGPIPELEIDQIRAAKLSNGETIPTLGETLQAIAAASAQYGRQEFVVWIELKTLPPSADPSLFRAIENADRVVRCAVHSFDHRLIRRLATARPTVPYGVLSASYPVDPISQLTAAGAGTLWQEWRLIDRTLVDVIHQHGARIIAWTVRDEAIARRLVDFGVDELCADRPW